MENVRVKFFTTNHDCESPEKGTSLLENMINVWLEKDNEYEKIINIKYQINSAGPHRTSLIYSAIILYKKS